MADEKEVVITYETLYEALRKEKTKQELQKLDQSFYLDVLEYLRDKQKTHDDGIAKNDMFSDPDKTHIQIMNIKKLVKEIYDMRERKIINMALNKSRTQTNIIDTTTLLPEEKTLFESSTNVFNQYRTGVLLRIQSMREPDVAKAESPKKERKEESKKSITFIENVEPFADEELEMWGPYEKGDEAELPTKIAEVLINQGKAISDPSKHQQSTQSLPA